MANNGLSDVLKRLQVLERDIQELRGRTFGTFDRSWTPPMRYCNAGKCLQNPGRFTWMESDFRLDQ